MLELSSDGCGEVRVSAVEHCNDCVEQQSQLGLGLSKRGLLEELGVGSGEMC